MYLNYFGLHTEPFSIAPDPQFLYLSERHQEALAHLSYGLQGSGGFILLTGEVGTGKTTVSRALLEQLPDHTRTAFILNPMLNADELLATLCDRSEEHTSELQSRPHLVCRLLLEKKKNTSKKHEHVKLTT